MNIYNAKAAAAGLRWAIANPNAKGGEIDNAATKYCPFDPARRHFQDAARWAMATTDSAKARTDRESESHG